MDKGWFASLGSVPMFDLGLDNDEETVEDTLGLHKNILFQITFLSFYYLSK